MGDGRWEFKWGQARNSDKITTSEKEMLKIKYLFIFLA